MALEVIWMRQFAAYLGNVVYAFGVILALYLGATFAGSKAYCLWVRSHDPQKSAPAWILLGFFALLPMAFADPSFPISTERGTKPDSYWRQFERRWVSCLSVDCSGS
jgi:hypothetical protein